MLVYSNQAPFNNSIIKGSKVVNKKDIEDRVIKIKAEMEQTTANFAKLQGHLAEAMHWLEIINQVGAEFEKTLEAEKNVQASSQDTQQAA